MYHVNRLSDHSYEILSLIILQIKEDIIFCAEVVINALSVNVQITTTVNNKWAST